MLYCDTPHLELELDPADGSHLRYPVPDMREVQPGVLATGQWTVNHPFVDAYLAALARLAPKQRPHQGPGASVPSTAATSPIAAPHALPDAHSHTHAAAPVSVPQPPSALVYAPQNDAEKLRWRAHHGGIASALTVAQVITVQYELFPGAGSAWYAAQVARLSEEQKKAVFALAALKVLNHPTHPAHWALWAKNVLRRTAQVVEEVFHLKPCPIVSHVGWLGLPESVWALQGLQSTFVPPPPPQPEKPKAGGMTLRKRKAAAAAQAHANAPTTSSNSSSSTLVEEETAPTRVSPRKRQRTTRAQAALAQAQEEESAATTATAPTPSEEAGATSMLLDVPPPHSAASSDPGAIITKAVKQEHLADASGSPALQPLELGLALPDSSAAPQHESAGSGTSTTARSPSASAASLSPGATRRSTRARRKPAQGPVTLSAGASTASTPLSALSTPAMSPAPLLPDRPLANSQPGDAATKHARAGSCGSSTAVSEAGEVSEGTVVDVDVDDSEAAAAKGKRKAVELELDDEYVEPAAEPALAEKPQDAARTTAQPKGGKKARAKTGAARPKKRVKLDDAPQAQPHANPETEAEPVPGGEENVPPVPVAAPSQASSVSAKKKAASAGAGGGGASSKRKAAVRRA
ncbi:hypothetical protein OH77DRAFT_1392919 [Trametes cingulata]|nr:hypothetical protein OH77DRAFT_1392919 [Trametes cingulata]